MAKDVEKLGEDVALCLLLDPHMSFGQHLASGGLSGFAAAVFLQPFDLVKTRMQQGGTQHGTRSIATISRNVIAANGIVGLWRGTLPTLARNVPGVALYMSTLQQIRAAMAKSPYFSVSQPSESLSSLSVLPSLTSQGNLVAAAAARTLVGVLLNPLSVMKARYESGFFAYRNLGDAFWSLLRSGPSQLFRGASASALRDAPYASIFLVSYEHLKRESASLLPPVSSSSAVVINALIGAGAGTVATFATHPFDVLKTRLQVRNDNQYKTLRGTARAIWIDRGLVGFFDGASLRLSRKVLGSAIGWAVYEASLRFMHNSSKSRLL